jgi:hypothetical protein
MRKKLSLDFHKAKGYFLRNKRKVIVRLLIALALFVATLLIIGFRIGYPFYFILSLPFFFASVYYAYSSLLFDRRKIERSLTYQAVRHFINAHKIGVVLGLILIVGIHVFLTVSPVDQNPFKGMSKSERAAMVEEDLHIATVLMDNLELSGKELLLKIQNRPEQLTVDERQELMGAWNLFLSVAIESEKLTDIHRYFNNMSIFTEKRPHIEAFIIAYSLYIKKYEIFHELIVEIGGDDTIMKVLNEHSRVFGQQNSYDDVLDRFFSSDSFLRRSIGRGYLAFISLITNEDSLPESYSILREEAEKSHFYLLRNIFNTGVHAAGKGARDLEQNLYGTWFPVQKNVANIMGELHVSKRNEKLITLEQIEAMRPSLRPGDLMVQRRNWYASNVGIPGFWPHAALYIGTPEEMESYFGEFFPRDGYGTLRELLEDRHPEFAEVYYGTDARGDEYAILEGKAPGIILQSLEESAHADYIGVMRATISKEDVFESVLRALENFGKPYDYDFDFETRDELVCSELLYDAYKPTRTKEGVAFLSSMASGRKIYSANSFVEKYDQEYGIEGAELDFVYFIDGDEKNGVAFVGTEESFRESWKRPRYSWFLE